MQPAMDFMGDGKYRELLDWMSDEEKVEILKLALGVSFVMLPFRGNIAVAQETKEPEWMLSGPAETSKTMGGLTRLDADMRKHPHAKATILRKVRADMGGTVLETWDRVLGVAGKRPTVVGGAHPEWFDYDNGSRVYVGGMDRPGAALSSERDAIYVNQAEDFDLEDWETLITRTTGRGAVMEHTWLGGDCNPGPSHHWIPNRESLQLLPTTHKDNPSLYDRFGEITKQGEKTLKALSKLTGVRHDRLALGLWKSAEGAIYDLQSYNKLTTFEPPRDWRKIVSIDFGYVHPFVAQWWAIDEDGRMYLYREIYMTNRIVQDHAKQIIELSEGEDIEAYVTDHDSEDRATLEKAGIPTTKAIKDVSVGIQATIERLRKKGDGKPRLFVVENAVVERDPVLLAVKGKATCTLQEFDAYVWAKNSTGKTLLEKPVKKEDDGMDAMRYAVCYVDEMDQSSDEEEDKEPEYDNVRPFAGGRPFKRSH